MGTNNDKDTSKSEINLTKTPRNNLHTKNSYSNRVSKSYEKSPVSFIARAVFIAAYYTAILGGLAFYIYKLVKYSV